MDMTTEVSSAMDSFLWLFQGDETGTFCRAASNLHGIVRIFRQESVIHDNLQEEMLPLS